MYSCFHKQPVLGFSIQKLNRIYFYEKQNIRGRRGSHAVTAPFQTK